METRIVTSGLDHEKTKTYIEEMVEVEFEKLPYLIMSQLQVLDGEVFGGVLGCRRAVGI